MSITIVCPGCGLSDKGPDQLLGKRVKCKRCKQGFVVGGDAAVALAPAQPPGKAPAKTLAKGPTKAPAPKPTSDASLDFGEPEVRSPGRPRPKKKGPSLAPFIMPFLIGAVLGGGGVGGCLYMNRPTAESSEDDGSKAKKEEAARFTWIGKGATDKSKSEEK